MTTDVPCGLVTVTLTHRSLPGEGGATTMEVAAGRLDGARPGRAETDRSGVGQAGAVDRDRLAARDRIGGGAEALDRRTAVAALQGDRKILLLGRAEARRRIEPVGGGVQAADSSRVKSLFPVVTLVKFDPLPAAAYSAGLTRPTVGVAALVGVRQEPGERGRHGARAAEVEPAAEVDDHAVVGVRIEGEIGHDPLSFGAFPSAGCHDDRGHTVENPPPPAPFTGSLLATPEGLREAVVPDRLAPGCPADQRRSAHTHHVGLTPRIVHRQLGSCRRNRNSPPSPSHPTRRSSSGPAWPCARRCCSPAWRHPASLSCSQKPQLVLTTWATSSVAMRL